MKAAIAVLALLMLTGCQSLLGREVAVIRVVEYSGGWYGFIGLEGVAVHQSNPDAMRARVQVRYSAAGKTVVVDTGGEDVSR